MTSSLIERTKTSMTSTLDGCNDLASLRADVEVGVVTPEVRDDLRLTMRAMSIGESIARGLMDKVASHSFSLCIDVGDSLWHDTLSMSMDDQ